MDKIIITNEDYNKLGITLIPIKNHISIKQSIIDSIKKMGIHSKIDDVQSIANTDWHLNSNVLRLYYNDINNIMNTVCETMHNALNVPQALNIKNYWFQQYKEKDFHTWHTHGNCIFSAIYYVDLDNKCSRTTFRLLNGSEFSLNVKEGDVLVFPSYMPHTSKPNLSNKTKTIVSFNMDAA